MIKKFSNLFFSIILKGLESRTRIKSQVEIRGPVSYNSKEFTLIKEFRTRQIAQSVASYLEDHEQLEIEKDLQIDERSLHFYLTNQEQITACLRLTPRPFELSSVRAWTSDQEKVFDGYYEFSRLCTSASSPMQVRSIARLLLHSAYYVLTKKNAKGFIGLCRPERKSFLQKMGLKVCVNSFWIPQRQGYYFWLAASRFELLIFYCLQIIRNKYTPINLYRNRKRRKYFYESKVFTSITSN